VTAIGDIGLSKIDRGEAGRKGAAFGKRCCCSIGDLGGARNGFTGELGETSERSDAKGDGVSGSQ